MKLGEEVNTGEKSGVRPEMVIGDIYDSHMPWLRLLLARHFNRDLNTVLRQMSEGEVREMIAAIQVGSETKASFLTVLGLPKPEDGGFWMGTVLPLLRKRLHAKPKVSKHRSRDIFVEAKQRVPVEDLAGRYTALKPAGAGKLKGLCPLHVERTASFYAYTDRGRWHCFGACHRGGDVIELARLLKAVGSWKT